MGVYSLSRMGDNKWPLSSRNYVATQLKRHNKHVKLVRKKRSNKRSVLSIKIDNQADDGRIG